MSGTRHHGRGRLPRRAKGPARSLEANAHRTSNRPYAKNKGAWRWALAPATLPLRPHAATQISHPYLLPLNARQDLDEEEVELAGADEDMAKDAVIKNLRALTTEDADLVESALRIKQSKVCAD